MKKKDFNELEIFPEKIRKVIESHGDVYHIAYEIGQEMSLNIIGQKDKTITSVIVTAQDVAYTMQQIQEHNEVAVIEWTDNHTGLVGQLVRVIGLFTREGDISGLAIRFGKSIPESHILIQDILDKGNGVLLMGPPGMGKTTTLRSGAGYLAQRKNVTILDLWISDLTSGGGYIHPSIRGASVLRGAVKDRAENIILAVQGLLPQWLVMDELSHQREIDAVLSGSRKGVAIYATCHGKSLGDFVNNPVLCRLAGDIQEVILSGSTAQARGLKKQAVKQRTGSAAFEYLVQMLDPQIFAIYKMEQAVDMYLEERNPEVEIRSPLGSQWSTMMDLEADVAKIRSRIASMNATDVVKPIKRVYLPDLTDRELKMIYVSYGFISVVDDEKDAEISIYSPKRYERMMKSGVKPQKPVLINTGKIEAVLESL